MKILVSTVLFFVSDLAFGHEIDKRFNLFAAGLLHPLTGIESLLTLVAFGLFAGMLGAEKGGKMMTVASWSVPLGSLGAYLMPQLPWNDTVSIGMAVTLGLLLVAAPPRIPAALGLIMAVAAGGYQGELNMSELKDTPMFGTVLFVAGLSLASATTLAVFLEVAKRAVQPWARIGLRVAGSWIAAAGLMRLVL